MQRPPKYIFADVKQQKRSTHVVRQSKQTGKQVVHNQNRTFNVMSISYIDPKRKNCFFLFCFRIVDDRLFLVNFNLQFWRQHTQKLVKEIFVFVFKFSCTIGCSRRHLNLIPKSSYNFGSFKLSEAILFLLNVPHFVFFITKISRIIADACI